MSCKLELRDVSLSRGENTILDNVSLTVEPGGVAVFGGRGGSGKSSLLEICAGLIRPDRGAALWNGVNVSALPRYDLYSMRKSLGYVFQVHALISNHSVFANIELPLKCHTSLSVYQRRELVEEQMDELGIDAALGSKFPEALSAAQLRSVAIARALVNDPKLLLLDDPLIGVDPFTADRIIKVIRERWRRCGMSIVMASHSINAWPEWNTSRYFLNGGRLERAAQAFGQARNIIHNQRYNYGGK